MAYLAHHPHWLVGGLGMGASLLFQSLALYFVPMSLGQPVLVFEPVLALVLRRVKLVQVVRSLAWTASVLSAVLLGIFLFAATHAGDDDWGGCAGPRPQPGARSSSWCWS